MREFGRPVGRPAAAGADLVVAGAVALHQVSLDLVAGSGQHRKRVTLLVVLEQGKKTVNPVFRNNCNKKGNFVEPTFLIGVVLS